MAWNEPQRYTSGLFGLSYTQVPLIITQALAEELPLVSINSQFDVYGVKRVW